jgi:hypothetical protein
MKHKLSLLAICNKWFALTSIRHLLQNMQIDFLEISKPFRNMEMTIWWEKNQKIFFPKTECDVFTNTWQI